MHTLSLSHWIGVMQKASNVVKEIYFGDSVMLFHKNLIFPNTMQKVLILWRTRGRVDANSL